MHLYYNAVLDGSVILFVRYGNHFPVVHFQKQAHFRNPHGTGQDSKTIWGAAGAPNILFFFRRRRRQWLPKDGAEGAAPPEAEGNPAEGGCFASKYIYIYAIEHTVL